MAPDEKPRDKGLGDYAKDFVGGLLGRDDDDDQASKAQNKAAQPTNEAEDPHDKGIVEYTKDFVGGLFGRDDDDEPKAQAAPKKDDDLSFAERVEADARAAAERAQAQAQAQAQKQGGGGGGGILDRVRDAAEEAQKHAQEAQKPAAPSTSAAPHSSFDQPAKPSTSNTDQSELERLRARVADLEREQSAAQTAAPKQRTYIVKEGDSLSGIAKHIYGDAMQWKRIYDANRGKISNPDLIYPDQEFIIPE